MRDVPYSEAVLPLGHALKKKRKRDHMEADSSKKKRPAATEEQPAIEEQPPTEKQPEMPADQGTRFQTEIPADNMEEFRRVVRQEVSIAVQSIHDRFQATILSAVEELKAYIDSRLPVGQSSPSHHMDRDTAHMDASDHGIQMDAQMGTAEDRGDEDDQQRGLRHIVEDAAPQSPSTSDIVRDVVQQIVEDAAPQAERDEQRTPLPDTTEDDRQLGSPVATDQHVHQEHYLTDIDQYLDDLSTADPAEHRDAPPSPSSPDGDSVQVIAVVRQPKKTKEHRQRKRSKYLRSPYIDERRRRQLTLITYDFLREADPHVIDALQK